MANPDKILVVDDDPEICKLLTMSLSPLGYEVTSASDGFQALEQIETERFNVLILDILLPHLNGIEVLKRVREQGFEMEVIVLTAYASLKTAIEAVRLGAYDYITKPCKGEVIRSTVRRALEKQHLATRLAAVYDLSREMALLLDADQVIRAVLDIAGRALEFGICDLWLVDEERDELYLPRAQEATHRLSLKDETGITATVARSGEPLYVPDVQEDPRYAAMETANRSELAVPLKVKDRVIGVLSVASAEVDAFTPEDEQLLSTLSAQAAVAIENAWLYQEERRRAGELAVLNKVGQAITSTLDLDEVLTLVMTEVRAMLGVEAASVLLHDAEHDELIFTADAGPATETLVGTRMPATMGIAGWVMQEGRQVLVDDVRDDLRFYDGIDAVTGLTTRSLLAMPLVHKGRVIGVIEAINKADGVFDKYDQNLLSTLAGSAAVAIENARLYEAEQEQRRLVEQSQAQLVQSEKLAATGRLAASLAHEINNPFQAIHNSLQIMLNFSLEPEEQREYLQTAEEEVERLIDLTDRILDFARRPQRKMELVNLNEVIEKTLALADKYFQHRNILLQRDLSPDLPDTLAASDELGQVFLNLVINAVDAMPEGGNLRVSSYLAEDGRRAVTFSDTGCGIPHEHLDRIFEPFFSTKEGGTGLGLSVSYSVVERHGGDITVQSTEREGTTFTVWLPAPPA
jgi:signal transduction histidine kinase/DNA-binding response OmpR family regulator